MLQFDKEGQVVGEMKLELQLLQERDVVKVRGRVAFAAAVWRFLRQRFGAFRSFLAAFWSCLA